MWKGTIDYLPPIACDIILSLISNSSEAEDDVTPIEDKLLEWRRLPMSYHHDQMNLCRFYGPLGMSIMDEGLRLKELNLLLSTAYSQTLKAKVVHCKMET